jgi:exodeoxyribonuclease V alpha subunit
MSIDVRARMEQAVAERRAASLELALVDWALRHDGGPTVAVALASSSRAIAEGHSCLALDHELPSIPGEPPVWDRQALEAALHASGNELIGESSCRS